MGSPLNDEEIPRMFARGSRVGERGRVATEITAIRASALRGPAGFCGGTNVGIFVGTKDQNDGEFRAILLATEIEGMLGRA